MLNRLVIMIKEAAKTKRKKPIAQISFRESAAKAFEDVLRTAARNDGEIALSIEGTIVVIEAKRLRNILAHHHGNSIETEILQYAQVKHP
jgi:hypothetical protein